MDKKSLISIIFILGQKRFGCQSCYRLYHHLENKNLLHELLTPELHSENELKGVLRVQHEKQEGIWGGVLQGIVCLTLGLAALCHVLHVFGNVVHVGDVRPLLWVGVDAHIYQFPQLL